MDLIQFMVDYPAIPALLGIVVAALGDAASRARI